MENLEPIAILGGGVAGLAAGSAARGLGLPCRVFEKSAVTGGICRTFRCGEFRFDSGAHRFHARDAAANRLMRDLLGGGLRRVSVASELRYRDARLTFPFTAGELAANLGWPFLFRTAGEILA